MSTVIAVVDQLGRPVPRDLVTFEQFHDWLADGVRAEWVDGEVAILSPSSLDHALIVAFLVHFLRAFAEARSLGVVLTAPFLMRLASRSSGREPDVMFLRAENASRLAATYVDGPADIVIEVTSPESDTRDRGEKLAEYEAARVPEYWLIDPIRHETMFNILGDDGRYHLAPLDSEARFISRVLPGLVIRPEWFWQRPLPKVADALAQAIG
jgi:Uma2 family endonuclease